MSHHKKEVMGSDGHDHRIGQFINCGTSYLVYGIICPCGLLDVGRTTLSLRVRLVRLHKCSIINGNVYDHHMKNKRHNYSVPRHFKDCHNGNPTGLQVFGIEAIKKDDDVGRRFQTLCKREIVWILTLGPLSPAEMNEDLEVHGVV